jgi:hypothetical protein
VGKAEAGVGESRREGTGAGEQGFIGHLAQGKAESEGRGAQFGRAMDGVSQGAREFSVGDGVGSGEVDWTGEGRGIKGEENGGDCVVKADPAHPLLTGAQRAAQSEAKEREHAGQRTPVTQDNAKAEMDNAYAGVDSRLRSGFPLLAEIRQEP